MLVRFIPNAFAKRFFGLTCDEYIGIGLTNLLEITLGQDNYDEFMVDQDPFCSGRTSGTIRILLNRGEHLRRMLEFATIGVVEIL